MIKRQEKRWRVDLAILTLSVAIGAAGFSMHRANACDKRGSRQRTEEFELEVVTSEIQGQPHIAGRVDVGDTDVLYKNGIKGTRIVLTLAGLSFERSSQ